MLDGDGMEEIKQLFFEESDEGLDIMESGLLNLEEGAADLEVINDIFRAAHSIKGGAATFAFTKIAEFTHGAETLLDEMRDGSRDVTTESIELLLKGVDCLREMMDSAKAGEDTAGDHIVAIGAQIQAMLADDSSASSNTTVSEAADLQDYIGEVLEPSDTERPSDAGWKIGFKPHRDFLKFGNKPGLIFRELAEIGELTIKTNTDDIPSLGDFDPQACYTRWDLELKGNIAKEVLDTVFEWVDDDCDLTFESLGANVMAEDTPTEQVQAVAADELTAPPVNETEQHDAAAAKPEPEENTAKEAEEPAVVAKPKKAAANAPAKSAGSIRVGIEKIDALLNLVGELVITQSMLKKVGGEISETINENLEAGLSQLETNARELQEVAMNMRMLPINNTFTRFPRMVHDLCKQLDKQVDLQISGEHTELDKTVLEKVGDPLVHLVRNALDHGIEMPADRAAAGKPEMGTMKLSAAHEAGNIVISISDDGAGINPEKVLAKARERGIVGEDEVLTAEEINHLIFRPGFSTAEVVSDVSGRGVGMDVVRRNIQDLGGRVEVESEYGAGSTFRIRLPLTMAILDGQLVRVGRETYIIPLLNIVESVLINMDRINPMGNAAAVYQLREQNIPVVRINEVMGGVASEIREEALEGLEEKILVVVDLGDEQVGLVVDELLDQQQVVIKSLETNYQQLDGLSGATILGDGAVALILDLAGLVNQCYRGKVSATASSNRRQPVAA